MNNEATLRKVRVLDIDKRRICTWNVGLDHAYLHGIAGTLCIRAVLFFSFSLSISLFLSHFSYFPFIKSYLRLRLSETISLKASRIVSRREESRKERSKNGKCVIYRK